MEIIVRSMEKTDWPQVAKIYQQGMDTNIATFQCECPSYEEWDQSYLKKCRLVILENNVVVGWAALTSISNRCVYAGIAEVSIYIQLEKQRKGLATQLLNTLINESETQGFWTLHSGIMQDNLSSIQLHEKCGFRMVGYFEKIGRDRVGNWRNTVLMERRSQLF